MRLPDLRDDELSPGQIALKQEIGRTRAGTARGPFAIWLRTPEVGAAANTLGNALRVSGTLDKGLFELAILVAARHNTAQYEWFAHERAARANGVPHDVVESIRLGKSPDIPAGAMQAVYKVASELTQARSIRDETYAEALAILGTEKLVELVSVIGFYTMVALVLNAFDVPVPEGDPPLP